MARPPGEAAELNDELQLARFEQFVLPHVDAAYNLARWLTRQEHDADDVVQQALLRAFQFIDGFHGTDGRACRPDTEAEGRKDVCPSSHPEG